MGSHEGHEGNEEEGSHEGHEADQEQARQSREQETACPWPEESMDEGRGAGAQGAEDHWLRCRQEGHTSVCKGKGVLQPVSATLSHMRMGSGKWRHQLQVWGFPQLWSAGAPGFCRVQ